MNPLTAHRPVNDIPLQDMRSSPASGHRSSGSLVEIARRATIPKHIHDVHSLLLRQGAPGHEPMTAQNAPHRVHASAAPGSGDAVINIPSESLQRQERELIEISGRLVAEENREFNPEHVAEFKAARETAIRTQSPKDWEHARKAMYRMVWGGTMQETENTMATMNAAYYTSGKNWYSLRLIMGSLLPLIPYTFPFFAALTEDPATKRNWAVGQFIFTLLSIEMGVVLNALVLLKIVSAHDLTFRWSPKIHRHLGAPLYKELATTMKELVEEIDQDFPDLTDTQSQEARPVPDADHLDRAIEKSEKGLNDYMSRVMLNDVYYDALAPVDHWSTGKTMSNGFSPYAGILAKDPRVASAVLIIGTLVQVAGQYFHGSGRSKVAEQHNMTNVMIFKATENDGHQLMRSPLDTRADMLKRILSHKLNKLEKEISQEVKFTMEEWKQYAGLFERSKNASDFTRLNADKNQKFDKLSLVAQNEVTLRDEKLQQKIADRGHGEVLPLCVEIARTLGMSADDYKKYSYLHAQPDARMPLTEEETQSLNDLFDRMVKGYKELSGDKATAFMQKLNLWEEIRHDPQYIVQRRLGDISDFNKEIAHQAMQVTDSTDRIGKDVAPEIKVALKDEFDVRFHSFSQMASTIAAGHWRAWTAILGGSQGSVVIQSLFNAIWAARDSYNGEATPAAWKAFGSALSASSTLMNIVAAWSLIRADPKPMTLKKAVNIASGPTGSPADGEIQNLKLVKRTALERDPKNHALIGFMWETAALGTKGLFALPVSAVSAHRARPLYDQLRDRHEQLVALREARRGAEAQEESTAMRDGSSENAIRTMDR